MITNEERIVGRKGRAEGRVGRINKTRGERIRKVNSEVNE